MRHFKYHKTDILITKNFTTISNKAYKTDHVCDLQRKPAVTINREYTAVIYELYGIITYFSVTREWVRMKRAISTCGKHKIERMIKLVDCNEGEMSFRFWDSERSIVPLFDKETMPEIKFIEKLSCNRNRISYCGNKARLVTKPPREEPQFLFFDKLQTMQRGLLCNKVAQSGLDLEDFSCFGYTAVY